MIFIFQHYKRPSGFLVTILTKPVKFNKEQKGKAWCFRNFPWMVALEDVSPVFLITFRTFLQFVEQYSSTPHLGACQLGEAIIYNTPALSHWFKLCFECLGSSLKLLKLCLVMSWLSSWSWYLHRKLHGMSIPYHLMLLSVS